MKIKMRFLLFVTKQTQNLRFVVSYRLVIDILLINEIVGFVKIQGIFLFHIICLVLEQVDVVQIIIRGFEQICIIVE